MKRELARRAGARSTCSSTSTAASATLRYDIRMEPGVFSPEETLERGHGSCRDFAWLLVQLLRRLGVRRRASSRATRSSSSPTSRRSTGRRASPRTSPICTPGPRSYLPGAGWIGFDATSGLLCAEGHIPLACTADPSSAAPISGSVHVESATASEKVEAPFAVEMKVERVREEPRVTKPYTEETWAAIDRAGAADRRRARRGRRAAVDGRRADVRVDRRSRRRRVEHRRARARASATSPSSSCDRMHGKFAPGGLLHYGQGKWYPGEPLPRWAMTCYFRKDGAPLWRRPELFARDGAGHATTAPARRAARADPRHRAAGRRRRGSDPARLRGHVLLPVARAAPAGERRLLGRALDDAASARGSRASSSRGCRRSSATCCRSSTSELDRARASTGAPARGRCAASASS